MQSSLSDDELLNVPLGNLKPGELARAFTVEAKHAHEVTEAAQLQSQTLLTRRDQESQKADHEADLHRRETVLLEQLRQREEQLQIEAERQDERAIKLADGRRAYVDGDKYRDKDGHELKGADRAQAEVAHVEQPNATTWQEYRLLEKKKENFFAMKRDVTAMTQGPLDERAEARLSAYERQVDGKADKQVAADAGLPSYGSADYLTALGGLAAAGNPSAQRAVPALSR